MLTRNSPCNFHLFACSLATSRSTKNWTWAPRLEIRPLFLLCARPMKLEWKINPWPNEARNHPTWCHQAGHSTNSQVLIVAKACGRYEQVRDPDPAHKSKGLKSEKTDLVYLALKRWSCFRGSFASCKASEAPKILAKSSKVPYLGVFPWRSALRGAQFFGCWTCAHPTLTWLYTKKNVYKGSSLPWYGPFQSHQNTCFRYFILSSISSFRISLQIHVQLHQPKVADFGVPHQIFTIQSRCLMLWICSSARDFPAKWKSKLMLQPSEFRIHACLKSKEVELNNILYSWPCLSIDLGPFWSQPPSSLDKLNSKDCIGITLHLMWKSRMSWPTSLPTASKQT